MQPEDALPTIAEISITLAGFTAVLFAVQSSFAGTGTPGQSDRILAILTIPAIVLVCALLPFGLAGLSASPAIIWGVPLCVYALFVGLQVLRTFARIVGGSAQVTWPLLAYGLLLVAALLAALALASGLGLFLPFSPGVLVLGLIWSLLSAAFALVTAVRAAGGSPAA